MILGAGLEYSAIVRPVFMMSFWIDLVRHVNVLIPAVWKPILQCSRLSWTYYECKKYLFHRKRLWNGSDSIKIGVHLLYESNPLSFKAIINKSKDKFSELNKNNFKDSKLLWIFFFKFDWIENKI